MKVLASFQEPLFRISVYGIPTCFALLDEAERVICALNTSVSILALEIVFSIRRDIASSDEALCGF